MADQVLRIEIDGSTPTESQLQYLALNSYGHFTAMQVHDAHTKGLDRHLARLSLANLQMFGTELDGDLVRDRVRHALGDIADASVRVLVMLAEDDQVYTVVTVRPPAGVPDTPHRLLSVPYQRPLPHLKQIGGGFGQTFHRRAAQRNGYTEALLTGLDGLIIEGGVTNVALFDGTGIVWPDAPALSGIAMQLLAANLADAGIPTRRRPVYLSDLSTFASMFVTSSRGIAAVARVDELDIAVDPGVLKSLSAVYDAVPWDRI
ncbi:MAG TPA: aminotransferase class IV [Pseudonocardiaceae bacterium]|nr:aminotransferase class IV [Pseudonocardiaceae bacterium]